MVRHSDEAVVKSDYAFFLKKTCIQDLRSLRNRTQPRSYGSCLYLDYRSVRSDSSRLIIEGGTWKPRSCLGFLPVT